MTTITPLQLAQTVADAYAEVPSVEAVALGGSLVTGVAGPDSDIDLYIYSREEVPLEARRAVATQNALKSEVNNTFFESGDEWLDAATGTGVDVMFRSCMWIEGHLKWLLEEHGASLGFSTSLWHNVLTSVPLFDRAGWYAGLQKDASQPYPEALQKAIIAKNHPLLRNTLSSYLSVIKKGVKRDDTVSLNHHTAALPASYFDVLFALNKKPHSGEKRVLEHLTSFKRLPQDMAKDVAEVIRLSGSTNPDLVPALNTLLDRLDELLTQKPS